MVVIRVHSLGQFDSKAERIYKRMASQEGEGRYLTVFAGSMSCEVVGLVLDPHRIADQPVDLGAIWPDTAAAGTAY